MRTQQIQTMRENKKRIAEEDGAVEALAGLLREGKMMSHCRCLSIHVPILYGVLPSINVTLFFFLYVLIKKVLLLIYKCHKIKRFEMSS